MTRSPAVMAPPAAPAAPAPVTTPGVSAAASMTTGIRRVGWGWGATSTRVLDRQTAGHVQPQSLSSQVPAAPRTRHAGCKDEGLPRIQCSRRVVQAHHGPLRHRQERGKGAVRRHAALTTHTACTMMLL